MPPNALHGLMTCGVTRVRRINHVLPDGTRNQDEGPIEFTFHNGGVLRLESGADGESLRLRFGAWSDPFAEPVSPDNKEFLAVAGKWTAFDVSADHGYRALIGQPIQDVSLITRHDKIIGVEVTIGRVSVSAEVLADELVVTVWHPYDNVARRPTGASPWTTRNQLEGVMTANSLPPYAEERLIRAEGFALDAQRTSGPMGSGTWRLTNGIMDVEIYSDRGDVGAAAGRHGGSSFDVWAWSRVLDTPVPQYLSIEQQVDFFADHAPDIVQLIEDQPDIESKLRDANWIAVRERLNLPPEAQRDNPASWKP